MYKPLSFLAQIDNTPSATTRPKRQQLKSRRERRQEERDQLKAAKLAKK